MIVDHLALHDFRNYREAEFDLHPGVTAVLGDNGQGKTNLAEALAYLATLSSFRGVTDDALVRDGTDRAVLRADLEDHDGRRTLVEAEIVASGRNRVLVNKQRLPRVRDLLGVVRVTVFSPDDLVVVKGGPADRRRLLDDALVALATKYDALRLELERIVRQRNTLLKQASSFRHAPSTRGSGRSAGRDDRDSSGGDLITTLEVWDERLADVGERFGHARATLVERCAPMVSEAYADLAGRPTPVEMRYDPPWRRSGLGDALRAARDDDVRRGVSTVGPHRDELELRIGGLPARTHASQGEQRTLALAVRLAVHRLVAERTGSTPVLVLDDVLSELDAGRAEALLGHLPIGQVVITSAAELPPAARPDVVLRIHDGARVSS